MTTVQRAQPRGPSQAARPLTVRTATGVIVARNFRASRMAWYVIASGFLEPVFYLLSIGLGVGSLIDGFTFNGRVVEYAAFVAPGMLAASAMNGAIMDGSHNFFFRLRYGKLFDQMLSTPLTTTHVALGQLTSSLLRGTFYSAAFLLIMAAMGMVTSWWGMLALPASILIGLAFGGLAMALTTWFRSWQDLEIITLITVPMFLFSATFFPLEAFPPALRAVVEWTPLYRGVVLCRELTTGAVTLDSLWSLVYLVGLGLVGLVLCRRRLDRLLLT